MPGCDGVIAHHVCFQFEFIKSMFEDIADADNSHKLIAILDGHMANPQLRHQLHYMGDRVAGGADNDSFCHQPRNS